MAKLKIEVDQSVKDLLESLPKENQQLIKAYTSQALLNQFHRYLVDELEPFSKTTPIAGIKIKDHTMCTCGLEIPHTMFATNQCSCPKCSRNVKIKYVSDIQSCDECGWKTLLKDQFQQHDDKQLCLSCSTLLNKKDNE